MDRLVVDTSSITIEPRSVTKNNKELVLKYVACELSKNNNAYPVLVSKRSCKTCSGILVISPMVTH